MVKVCPHCGTQAPDDSYFCPKCGYRLPDSSSPPPTQWTPAPTPAPEPSKHGRSKLPIIGAAVALVVILAIVVASVPFSSGGATYTPQEAEATLGGTWTVNNALTFTSSYQNGVYTFTYANGTTVKRSSSQLPGFGNSSGEFGQIDEYVTASVEVMNSSLDNGNVSMIVKLTYANSTIPYSIYKEFQILFALVGGLGGSTIDFGSVNGYNYTYFASNPQSQNGFSVYGHKGTGILAYGDNSLILVGVENDIVSQSQMQSVLQSIT